MNEYIIVDYGDDVIVVLCCYFDFVRRCPSIPVKIGRVGSGYLLSSDIGKTDSRVPSSGELAPGLCRLAPAPAKKKTKITIFFISVASASSFRRCIFSTTLLTQPHRHTQQQEEHTHLSLHPNISPGS